MRIFILSISCILSLGSALGQDSAYTCYPPSWWKGMKWNNVQVMIHGKNISTGELSIAPYPGVKLARVHKVAGSNYLFADLQISPVTKPGVISFKLTETSNSRKIASFEIKARRAAPGTAYAQGVTTKDLIYLIMPDRFSNGDTTNDRVAGMRDQTLNRDTVFNRHGGDLKGIQNHLAYLDDLGVTTIWLNPVLENDMPNRTEHGYAFTDHYKVDRRLGGDKAYQDLIDAIHGKGMKIIQDAVYNHVGSFHHTVLDPPMPDWLNQWPKYTNTTYKDQTLFDPYASQAQKKQMSDGWFTPQMPDINQKNPFAENFLIQHALWTVERFGIDGWRIDTYAYNDLDFMNRCNKALMDQYPRLTLFGETWVHGVVNQSYFCENNLTIPFKSNLQGATDFQTLWGITNALTKDFGWNEGVNELYRNLAQDIVYKNPTRNVIFLDNHDMSRFYSIVGEDMNKYQSAISWLLTSRGIPQMYYGDELATTGTTSPNDGYVRLDFPGGWQNDTANKFEIRGRSQKDQAIFQHFATLANFRKASTALTTGKFMQFYPEDAIYTYFRYNEKQTVMVVMNASKDEKEVKISKYAERTNGFTKYKDAVTKETGTLGDFRLGAYKTVVYELLR